ncbi:MAG: GNAT family N-acetyltransferase [bacterium]|nr:GNAT family N-acetyltransferase [bacterium]
MPPDSPPSAPPHLSTRARVARIRRRLLRVPLQFFRRPVTHPPQKQSVLRSVVRASTGLVLPYRFRLRAFRCKVPVYIELKNFVLKTVETPAELDKILRLRYRVFYKEFLEKRRFFAIDMDEFDAICDHLMILEKKSNTCVGTYRLNCSTFNDHFYSATEFAIDAITALPGVKLELGRACVHKDYRKGVILTLLWRGLSEYVKATNTSFMFGCSSVKTTDPLEAAVIYHYLMSHYPSDPSCRVTPLEPYRMRALPLYIKLIENLDVRTVEEYAHKLVPPLLSSYLRAGAVICGEPALDKDFKCIDFFTLHDMSKLSRQAARKFL